MDTRDYILHILWRPELKDEKITEEIEKLKKIIEVDGSSISSVGAPKRRRLGRPIKKTNECFYSKIGLSIFTTVIEKIKEHYKYNTNVLRYSLYKKES